MLQWFLCFIMACRTGLPDNRLRRSFSRLYSGISRFLTIFDKKSLKVFATSVSLDSTLSLLTKIIVSLDLTLSERKGLTVCQKFLLSVISFSFNLEKYSFFSFPFSLFVIEFFVKVSGIFFEFVSETRSLHNGF